MKPALVESSRGKPDTHAIMHQDFHPVCVVIFTEISTVRLCRTEHHDDSVQCGLGTGAHIHELGGEPDDADANHRGKLTDKVRIL